MNSGDNYPYEINQTESRKYEITCYNATSSRNFKAWFKSNDICYEYYPTPKVDYFVIDFSGSKKITEYLFFHEFGFTSEEQLELD